MLVCLPLATGRSELHAIISVIGYRGRCRVAYGREPLIDANQDLADAEWSRECRLRNGDSHGGKPISSVAPCTIPVQATGPPSRRRSRRYDDRAIGILRTRTAPNSVANTTSVSSSIPRVSRSSEQPGDRLIDPLTRSIACLEIRMSVHAPAPGPVLNLNKPHAALNETVVRPKAVLQSPYCRLSSHRVSLVAAVSFEKSMISAPTSASDRQVHTKQSAAASARSCG